MYFFSQFSIILYIREVCFSKDFLNKNKDVQRFKMKHPTTITNVYIAGFFHLDNADADEVLQKLERREYVSGDDIVRLGEEADALYFIDDGTCDVLDRDGEQVNEMREGQYFGEYGIIASEPRLTTVRARGKVVAYRMKAEDFLAQISRRPTLAGDLLKQVYGQLSMKHTKLLEIARDRRGILRSPGARTWSRKAFLLTHLAVAAVFILTYIFMPRGVQPGPFWMLLPLGFLVAFTLWTKQALEALILTVMLGAGVLNGGNFLQGFTDALTEGIAVYDTASTIVIMCLIGAVSSLLSAAGGISALRRPAEAHIRSGRGSLFAMIGIMALIFIDDCLNVLSAAFCLTGISDRAHVPREVPALIARSSTAICSLIPLSVWGAYLSGTMTISLGSEGGAYFLRSVPYNFASVLGVLLAMAAAAGVLPKIKLLRDADERVAAGGTLWPEGSEKYFLAEDDAEIYGHPANLLVPIAVMVVVSTAAGLVRGHGSFMLDPAAGLAAAVAWMFFSYVSQKLMTPEQFMDHMVAGIQSTALPILLLLLALCVSTCLDRLNCTELVARLLPALSDRHPQYLPALCYLIFTLLTLLLGSSWGMYGIGIPVACRLFTVFGGSLPLLLGAVCAAGITGDNLCPYIADGDLIATAIGCDPRVNRSIRMRYWAVIAAISAAGYLILGLSGT